MARTSLLGAGYTDLRLVSQRMVRDEVWFDAYPVQSHLSNRVQRQRCAITRLPAVPGVQPVYELVGETSGIEEMEFYILIYLTSGQLINRFARTPSVIILDTI